MKKHFILILTLLFSFYSMSETIVWDGTTATSFGTQAANAGENESNPILISTPQQLRYLASLVSNTTLATADAWKGKCYKMTADFDLNNLAFGRIGGAAGNPTTYQSQSASRPFTGVFDGDGHVISNLSLDISTGSWVALFPYLNGATVKNLGIGSGVIKGINEVAGLVGVADGVSKIINCNTNCSIISTGLYVGGLAACIYGNTLIDGCYNAGRVSSSTTTVSYFGGLVGQAGKSVDDSPIIRNSYNIGNVICVNGNLGGIVGYSENLTMSDCYNAADTLKIDQAQTGNVYAGGLIGRMKRNAAIDRCFNIGLVSSNADATKSSILGGICADAELIDLQNDIITINDCYNAGPIIAPVGTLKTFAGIAGVTRTVTINNCINYGSIYAGGENTSYKSGGITANYSSDTYTGGPTVVNDSYFDSNYIIDFTDSVNGQATTTAELLGNLPNNFDNSIWTASNSLLPRLTVTKDESASIVGATPILFSGNENYSNVSSNINLETGNSVVWTSSDPDLLTISGSSAIPHSQEPNMLVYLTAQLNNYKKIIPVTLAGTTGLNDIAFEDNSQITVYPNPGTIVNVDIKSNNSLKSNFIFYDMQGRMIDQIVKTGATHIFDLSKYPAGTILLNVRNEQINVFKRIINL